MTDFLDGETLREQRNAKKRDQYHRRYAAHPEQHPRRFGSAPEDIKETQRRYRERHPDRIKVNRARFFDKNPDALQKMNAQIKEWREAHREYGAPKAREWRINNPDGVTRNNANRRSRERSNGGKLSSDIVTRLMKRQKGKCVCCSVSLTRANRHLDHIMPIARGGPNDDGNVQLLCAPCNISKRARDPIEFMQSRGFLL